MILLNGVDKFDLFLHCEDLIEYIRKKNDPENDAVRLYAFITSLLDNETPKMSFVIAKKFSNIQALKNEFN